MQDIPPLGQQLLRVQLAYFANEGPNRRGDRFFEVAGTLMVAAQEGLRLSQFEVLMLLGAPDYVEQDKDGSGFAYLFKQTPTGWPRREVPEVAFIGFDQNVFVNDVTFNSPSQLDQYWKPYRGELKATK